MPAEAAIEPTTSRVLERWLFDRHAEMPADLQSKAHRVLLALLMIESNPPDIIQAFSKHAPNTWSDMMGDIVTFAQACGPGSDWALADRVA